ncbi:sulfate permease [Colletotrichum graminicola M1.001]|uniref:Sulfate permease n=1 Tax=Colletotrichum graminicola (strain M1.001 / M2 / FGSC 10212) TaxID=645133 RepID=E3QIF0_COLGM|nr:sulfate permease [Colletotrichum graminicola M1.001]EFQ30560.1 sulfate permease [Colletotrichum graminicola M1.001]
MAAGKAGAVLAKILGIDLEASTRHQTRELREHVANTISPHEPYYEEDPTVKEWLLEHVPTKEGSARYVKSLFPFTTWIFRYNTRWLVSDAIAGVTLGLLAIPQAVAYALLARLSPEYGLYTSFTGAALYWIFGTSKDMAVGATAVVSLLVGKVSARVLEEHPGEFQPEEISKTLAFLAGAVLLAFGLLRLDWVIEFIPHVAISAFVTAAAITITLSQIPSLLGIDGVNSKAAAYRVLIETARGLPRIKLDAAVGLTALALLAAVKWYCERMARTQPRRRRAWEMLGSLRMTFTIVLYTLVSFLVNRGLESRDLRFRITGALPRGLTHAGPPSLDPKLISALLPDLPTTVIIIVIEHIAIGKSFGRTNNYAVQPSQELISVGCTNLFGPFLGAYASTGSFGGTAILSKAGVRTPLAGLFNAAVLLLALYALTSVLYYIPMASLAALIVHAVANLITSPDHVFRSWLASPPDVFIYFAGVFASVFTTLENGIYVTVALSAALLLLRLARSKGRFLGRVRVHRHPEHADAAAATAAAAPDDVVSDKHSVNSSQTLSHSRTASSMARLPARDVFLPLDRKDGTNPAGSFKGDNSFVYRFTEGFNYLNQAQYMDRLLEHVTRATRQTTPPHYDHPGDRPWNEAPPPPSAEADDAECPATSKPLLRAIVLDCSAVNTMDSGAVEGLVDLRTQLDRWAAPEPVEWHFAGLHSRWDRRALAVSGFGCPTAGRLGGFQPVFSLADLEGRPAALCKGRAGAITACGARDSEELSCSSLEEGGFGPEESAGTYLGAVSGINRPFFHLDLPSAVENAVKSAIRKGRYLPA